MPAFKGPDGRWRYRFSHDGKRFAGSAPKGDNTKRAAEAIERRELQRARERRYTGTMPTLAEFVVRFLDFARTSVKPLTFESYDDTLRIHVLPKLGRRKLDEIGKRELDELKTSWTAAPSTRNTRLAIVRRVLNMAAEWDFIPAAPRVKSIKVAQDVPRFLTELEATALVRAAGAQVAGLGWREMIVLGLRTGLRIGELRGLQWRDVDLERAALMVRRTDPGRPDLDPTAPKGNRPRTLPLSPDAIAALRSIRGEHALGAFVFRGTDGESTRRGCSSAIIAITKAAGLADQGIHWHTLRHTYASWLVMRGVSIKVVQELLGHASIKQTERYSHLAPGFAQRADVASLDVPLVTLPALPSGDPEDA